ncbi:hypothetical protein RvY_09224 [Ramazzottius varieornatus]|uniref:Uncharacterized protein n=1 Tax=Ramazzottius varieornatus TaxID=947166 RepID=A0A1D1VAV1_RAMVA|nr:hypothetical protein RvY_09224 [Ramazzottius varieornatus]
MVKLNMHVILDCAPDYWNQTPIRPLSHFSCTETSKRDSIEGRMLLQAVSLSPTFGQLL